MAGQKRNTHFDASIRHKKALKALALAKEKEARELKQGKSYVIINDKTRALR